MNDKDFAEKFPYAIVRVKEYGYDGLEPEMKLACGMYIESGYECDPACASEAGSCYGYTGEAPIVYAPDGLKTIYCQHSLTRSSIRTARITSTIGQPEIEHITFLVLNFLELGVKDAITKAISYGIEGKEYEME